MASERKNLRLTARRTLARPLGVFLLLCMPPEFARVCVCRVVVDGFAC